MSTTMRAGEPSRVQSCLSLAPWSVLGLVSEYGDLVVRRRDAIAGGEDPRSFEDDMAAIMEEVSRRITPGARDRAAVETLELISSELSSLLDDINERSAMSTTATMPASATVATEKAWTYIQIEEPDPGEFVGCLGHNSTEKLDDLDATQLRILAAEAVAAAEWLEARA